MSTWRSIYILSVAKVSRICYSGKIFFILYRVSYGKFYNFFKNIFWFLLRQNSRIEPLIFNYKFCNFIRKIFHEIVFFSGRNSLRRKRSLGRRHIFHLQFFNFFKTISSSGFLIFNDEIHFFFFENISYCFLFRTKFT